MHIRGPLPAVGFEDVGLNTLLENIRYVSFATGVVKNSFQGVTEHIFPLSEHGALSFKAGLDQLIRQYQIPANKLLITVPLFSYVHILNNTQHYLLGDASTLLGERVDLEGTGYLTYDQVENILDLIVDCIRLNLLNIQVCKLVLETNSTWTIYRDEDASSVFTTNTTQWVSFESPRTLMKKVDD
jgi:hypothetical protein